MVALAHMPVGDAQGDGRQPLLKKRCAKGKQIVAIGEIDVRPGFHAEGGMAGCAKWKVRARFVEKQFPADGAQKRRCQLGQRAGERATDHDDLALDPAELFCQLIQAVVP